ncbi:hypothetical protein XPA_001906 [Xanthoria parietina]
MSTAHASEPSRSLTFEQLLDRARRLCGSSKPPFAQERRGIEDGYLKEVFLIKDGKKPQLGPSQPRKVFIARRWDDKHYFWVLDLGTEKYIMKASGGYYRRCIGIDGNKKAVCEKNNFAFPVPSDRQDRSPNPTVPDSDPGVPEHFMNTSPFQRHQANLPVMSRKRRLSHDNNNEAIPNAASAPGPVSQNLTVQEIIEQDRAYFASRNQRPPYLKERSVHRQFTAVLADQDKRRSEHQIVAYAREWGDGLQYWIIVLDGQERIVEKVKGGHGGYRLRLWLGYKEYEHGKDGELIGFAPWPTKSDTDGQVTTPLEDDSVTQNVRQSMPPRIRKRTRHSEPSIRRDSNPLSRATSTPLGRPHVSQQSRSAQDPTQSVRKARPTKTQRLKDTGTTGYKDSPSATVASTPGPTPTDVGNGPSPSSGRSATEKPVSSAPVLTGTGLSPEELLQRKRDTYRKLLTLDMEDIDAQLKKAGYGHANPGM